MISISNINTENEFKDASSLYKEALVLTKSKSTEAKYQEQNQVRRNFSSTDDLVQYVDKDGDGSISVAEIKEAGKAFSEAGITTVVVGGKNYNVVTGDGSKKVKGTKGDDLIFAVGAKKVNGKGGDDIIFAGDCKKVKGKKGSDTIITAGNVKKVKCGRGDDKLINFGIIKKAKDGSGSDTLEDNGEIKKAKKFN